MKIIIKSRSRTAPRNVFYNRDLFDMILAHLLRSPALEVGKTMCSLATVNKLFKEIIDDARNKCSIGIAPDLHIDCEITKTIGAFRAKIRLMPSSPFYWLIGMTNQNLFDAEMFFERVAREFGRQISEFRRNQRFQISRSCTVSVSIETDALRMGDGCPHFEQYLRNIVKLKLAMNFNTNIRALKKYLKMSDSDLRVESRIGFFSRLHEKTSEVLSHANKSR